MKLPDKTKDSEESVASIIFTGLFILIISFSVGSILLGLQGAMLSFIIATGFVFTKLKSRNN